MTTTPTADAALHRPDGVSLRRWFVAYAAFLALTAGGAFFLAARHGVRWSDWSADPVKAFAAIPAAAKLLGFAAYLSLCCTFLPLPTGWIVAGVAMRKAAVAAGVTDDPALRALLTTLAVAMVGGVGSAAANLNDYHLFTWMLRRGGVAAVRQTRIYLAAARWFARSPFLILVIFNIVPIPVDVIRMLATAHRYPRLPFAAANFVGRFVRYGVIAFVTYHFNLGWVAVVALLALAVLLGLGRVGSGLVRRARRGANLRPDQVSVQQERQEP